MIEDVAALGNWSEWVVAVSAALVAIAGFVKWVLPRIRGVKSDARAIRDVLVGRDPIVDSVTKKEIHPALPSLGMRLAKTDEALADLSGAVVKIAETLTKVDSISADHEITKRRVKALEEAAIERVATRAESAQAWAAIAAVANANNEVTQDPHDDHPDELG